MKRITVLLVEDHTIVREGLRLLLDLEEDIEVLWEADNGRKAIELVGKHQPNVVLMDIAMPHLNGLEAARQILRNHPTTRILILTAHHDDPYIENALKLGIAGFLVKQTSSSMLSKAIRTVAAGKSYFSSAVMNRLSQQKADGGEAAMVYKKTHSLTAREMEVLQLIAEGMANKQTASELGISIKTVEKHRQSLMNKLNVHDTASLTRHAISSGVIESSIQDTT